MRKIELSDFKKFVGNWQTKGKMLKTENNPEAKIEGTDTYELILNGFYILHKASVLMGSEKSETFELIELDDSDNKTKMRSYNSKGESDLMSGFLDDREYHIEGTALRFAGRFNDSDTQLSGKWQILSEEKEWRDFLEINLTKMP